MYCYHYCYYVWHADLSCLFCSLPHSIDFVYDPGGFEMTECQATFDPKGGWFGHRLWDSAGSRDNWPAVPFSCPKVDGENNINGHSKIGRR